MTDSIVDLEVMKFGGSCLQDAGSFIQTSEIIKNHQKESKLVIVASAMKSVTDKLINFYNKCCAEEMNNDTLLNEIYNRHRKLVEQLMDSKTPEYRESMTYLRKSIDELAQLGNVVRLIRPSTNIQDLVISYGEKLSTFILSQYINSLGMKSRYIASNEIIITDDNFGNAMPILEDTEIEVTKKLLPLLNLDR